MRRSSFLKGTAGVLLGLRFGKLPPAVAAPEVAATSTGVSFGLCSMRIVATGGLCAPLSPIYDLPVSLNSHPIMKALPAFSAERGVRC